MVREEGDSSSPFMSLTGIDLTGSRIMAKNVPHFRWAGFDGSRSSQSNTAGVMQAVSRRQQLKCSNFKSFVCVYWVDLLGNALICIFLEDILETVLRFKQRAVVN